MDHTGHSNYERETSKLKLLNAAMQLGLLQRQLNQHREILAEHKLVRDHEAVTTITSEKSREALPQGSPH